MYIAKVLDFSEPIPRFAEQHLFPNHCLISLLTDFSRGSLVSELPFPRVRRNAVAKHVQVAPLEVGISQAPIVGGPVPEELLQLVSINLLPDEATATGLAGPVSVLGEVDGTVVVGPVLVHFAGGQVRGVGEGDGAAARKRDGDGVFEAGELDVVVGAIFVLADETRPLCGVGAPIVKENYSRCQLVDCQCIEDITMVDTYGGRETPSALGIPSWSYRCSCTHGHPRTSEDYRC